LHAVMINNGRRGRPSRGETQQGSCHPDLLCP
jgi:hypothetical protein